jgi:deazaflavin-dependent oxidoreductase (nitroreductase family)
MPFLARIRNRLSDVRWLSVWWTRTHVRIVRATKGRLRFGFLFGGDMPVLALTTTGRKSGEQRSIVIAYLPHGDSYAVVASNAGSDRTPAWWLNLQANPAGEVDAEGERVSVRARVVEGAERDELWRRFVDANESYERYRGYTARELPVVALDRAQTGVGSA